MKVVVCHIELYLAASQSLKDKRQVVKSLIGRIRARVNASAAEVGFHDLWQRAAIGVAMVGTEAAVLEGQLTLIRRLADQLDGAEVVVFDVEYI
ncbi:MAG: DUF503 domain-containing protein [Sporomusaceae bacterium]|nr:DUF503 domain-containing protein [Sporomusaceae bacterium]